MNVQITTPLAVALFEAYSRNCGHNPDEHFDRNAAEQWMTQALEECGVPELLQVVIDGLGHGILVYDKSIAARLVSAYSRVFGAAA
jgi:hypothetical protein